MNVSKIAIIGSATIDTIVKGEESVRQLGGVVAYAGLTFRRHGIETFVVTNMAERDQSILDVLKGEGIQILVGNASNTTHFINHIDGFHRWQEMPVHADPITSKQLKDVLDLVGHLHIGALHPGDIDGKALTLINEKKLIVSMDVQGFVRYKEDDRIISRVSDNLAQALSCARYVKADDTELETILNACNMDLPELMQTFGIDETVITKGERGGFVRSLTGEEASYSANPVDSIRNTVGAGDVFFASYLIHRLYGGEDMVISCGKASQLAARQIEGRYIRPETLKLTAS